MDTMFAQNAKGTHFIRQVDGMGHIQEIKLEISQMSLMDIQDTVNALANMLSSISTVLPKFYEER